MLEFIDFIGFFKNGQYSRRKPIFVGLLSVNMAFAPIGLKFRKCSRSLLFRNDLVKNTIIDFSSIWIDLARFFDFVKFSEIRKSCLRSPQLEFHRVVLENKWFIRLGDFSEWLNRTHVHRALELFRGGVQLSPINFLLTRAAELVLRSFLDGG